MKNNKTIDYALLATGYIAEHSKEGIVESSLISEQCNIPPLYLLKVLGKLIKANILHSKRGIGGGYTLDCPANEITILEIIEAVDGPMFNHLCLAEYIDNSAFILKMEKVCQSATAKEIEIYGKSKLSDMLS